MDVPDLRGGPHIGTDRKVNRLTLAPPMAVEQPGLEDNVGERGGVGGTVNGDASVGIADDEIVKNAIRVAAEADARGTRRKRAINHSQILAAIRGNGVVAGDDEAIRNARVSGAD